MVFDSRLEVGFWPPGRAFRAFAEFLPVADTDPSVSGQLLTT